MKRLIVILLALLPTMTDIMASTLSATLSINSLTTESPVNLVRADEILEMTCSFTANVSLTQLPTLEQTLNTELQNAGIRSLDIVNVRKHSTSESFFLTLRFGVLGADPTRVFNIITASGVTTITLICDRDGILDSFVLVGEWLSDTSEDFTLKLSGSQQTVIYNLQKDGRTKCSMIGTGWALDFGQFSDKSSHGTYQVVAQYKDWEDQIAGSVRMVRKDDIGGQNYTAVRTYMSGGEEEYNTDVIYYNGLGYPDQEISINGTTDSMNIVRPIVYDNMLRSDTKYYVPYCSTGDTGMHIQDAIEEQRRFYTMMDNAPFYEKTFEAGTEGRELTIQRPGGLYRENNKKAKIEYGINDGSEGIFEFAYNYPTSNAPASVTKTGNYASGTLRYTMTTSENDDVSYVFSDAFDKTILQRKISEGTIHDTYFIYDLRDSLVCVIQPEGSMIVPESFSFGNPFCKNYCFTYIYDARGNIIEKTIPGAGKMVMVYDQRNRLVLSADDEMLTIGKYKYILYDSMDRVTQEGYASLKTTLENVRNAMYGTTTVSNYTTSTMITRSISYYTNTTSQTPTINSRCKAYRQGVNMNYCLTLPASEIIYAEPHISGSALSRSGLYKMVKYFYDKYGRLTLMTEDSSDGWTSVYSWQNDFTGNVLKYTEEHYKAPIFDSMVVTYTYDSRGRRRTMSRNLNGKEYAPVSYDYDAFGRLRVKDVKNRGAEVYGYNIQGWQESSSAYFYGYDVFSQTMNYHQPFLTSSEPRYDGMISETRYQHLDQDIQTVSYGYDGLQRLTDSDRFVNWDSTACNLWSENAIQYDLNGNIRHMWRRKNNGNAEEVYQDYLGNRMMFSQITGGADHFYEYYADGNLQTDPSRNLQFQYNLLNLPAVVTNADGQTTKAEYVYYADGSKYRISDATGSGYVYRGSFVYNRSSTGSETLESVGYDEGRLIATYPSSTTTQFIDTWHVKDYLGSVRVILDITNDTSAVSHPSLAIIEQNDYLPFGMRVESANMAYDLDNRYRYNGKEEQVIGNLNLIDYGARFYDNTFTRWTTPDPLAENQYHASPYVFCSNDPINRYDSNGKWDITVRTMNDRERNPYAIMTVTDRNEETIYRTVVKVKGIHRNRSKENGDTPIGEYKIHEWRQTGTNRYPVDSYGPYDLLALIYLGEEGAGRNGIHLHGGRSQLELSNTLGCIRISDEDIRELKTLTDALEALDPDEQKGRFVVDDKLTETVNYSNREDIKYTWDRYLGELPAAVVIATY